MPSKYIPSGAVGIYDVAVAEVRILDYGVPVDIQVPPEAIPATPLTSNEPTAIAEGFLQAAIAADFGTASEYFAPDKRPMDWGDVFPGNMIEDLHDDPAPDFCRGSSCYVTPYLPSCVSVGYEIVERYSQVFGVDYAEVTFVFEPPCVTQPNAFSEIRSDDIDDFVLAGQVRVTLEHGTGTWYVVRADVE